MNLMPSNPSGPILGKTIIFSSHWMMVSLKTSKGLQYPGYLSSKAQFFTYFDEKDKRA